MWISTRRPSCRCSTRPMGTQGASRTRPPTPRISRPTPGSCRRARAWFLFCLRVTEGRRPQWEPRLPRPEPPSRVRESFASWRRTWRRRSPSCAIPSNSPRDSSGSYASSRRPVPRSKAPIGRRRRALHPCVPSWPVARPTRCSTRQRSRRPFVPGNSPSRTRRASVTSLLGPERRRAPWASRLRNFRSEAMQHAAEIEAAIRARELAEQNAASVSDELARTREKASALGEQVAQLRGRLEQHQEVSSSELVREREQQQALTAQAQAHSARLIQDLHLERARSASCLESLQTLESRRQIAESATNDLQREMDSWQSAESELRGQLGGRDSRVHELENELAKRASQIAGLEQQLAALETKVAERDAQVRDSQRDVQTEQASVQRLQQEAVAVAEHTRELEARLAQHGAAEAQRQEELQRLRTQRAELDVMLAAERDATAAAVTETAAREAAFASERARTAQLEASLAAERQHVAELESEVTTMTGEMETWSGVLRNAQQERNAQLDGIQAAEERARSLEQELGKQRAAAQQLQADFEARSARVAELEGEVRMAGESIFRLEAELGSRSARIEALEKANEHWRTTAAVRDSSPPARGSGRAGSRRSRQPDTPRPEAPRPRPAAPEASEVPSREEIV